MAAPEGNQGIRLLRRSYNYDDGPGDALSPFAVHTASALFAVPPTGAKFA